jgi:hypothetical protein
VRLGACGWLAALLAVSCGRPGTPPAPAGFEYEKSYSEGAVTVTVKVSRLSITVADRLELVLEALTSEGAELDWPAFSGKLGDFTVTGASLSPPRLVDGGRVLREGRYELEPFLAGDYEIPPLALRLAGGRTIETEPVRIRVSSVLPPGEEAPELKEIAPPVELGGLSRWFYLPAGAALAGLGYAAYRLLSRRRSRRRAARGTAPHERALRELSSLMAEDLIGQGQSKLFYLRVSSILRRYIEERFGLRAPERTTEEFLADLETSRELAARQKELLKRFLEHCDMVKFAAHQPSRDEIDETINSCAQFIAETRPIEAGERGRPR